MADALADALSAVSGVDVVEPRMLFAPTPPAIDIYPATPSEADLAFGRGSRIHWWTIRLRVATADSEGVQDILLEARNTEGPKSIRAALLGSDALEEVADGIQFGTDSPSGFQLYEDASGAAGAVRFLGEEWRVGVMVSGDTET